MPALKLRDDYPCADHRCIITRTKGRMPSGIDLDRDGFAFDERGRFWARIVTDTPTLRVEERWFRDRHERIERHYHDPG